MTDAQTSALFAQASYDMLKKGNKEERLNAINETISHTGYKATDKSNRDMLHLEDDKGNVHIAIRGTDTSGKKTGQDVETDLKFALNQQHHDKHFKKKINRINNLVKNTDQDKKITLSGHSLGGGVVQESLKTKKNIRNRVEKAHTFNPASSPFTSQVNEKVKKDLDNKLLNHHVEGDIVSSFSKSQLQGKTKTYKPKENKHIKNIPPKLKHVFTSIDQFKVHSMDNFTNKNKKKSKK